MDNMSDEYRTVDTVSETRKAFAELIARDVPSDTLEALVTEDGVIKDFDILAKAAPSNPGEGRIAIACAVVDRYAVAGRLPHLAGELMRRMRADDLVIGKIMRFFGRANGDRAQEARLALRAHMMQSRKLRDFMAEVEGRVCAIASNITELQGRSLILGTGFLVGQDLVLTAYHNVEDHIGPDGKAIAGRHVELTAYFDFFDGDPVTDQKRPSPPSIAVGFAEDWLVEHRRSFDLDGELDKVQEAAVVADLERCLDFALVRLDESIGKQTLSASGGARRGWVSLSSWQQPLGGGERIVIAQHPEGNPQNIDFGTYFRCDQSGTRLRYSTETAQGTSGAPCFVMLESKFHLVGMHNATYRPSELSEANQAIDIKRIRTIIDMRVQTEAPGAPTRIWNASPDMSSLRVVLHRDVLLDWIYRAQNEGALSRRDRLYAAFGEGRNIGKTFSIDILRAACRTRTEPIVVLGSTREAIPDTAKDFLAAIADQLAIPRSSFGQIPPRPSAEISPTAGETDKLRKWASDDVPRWFDGVLGEHRNSEVDRREDARQTRDFLIQKGFAVPEGVSKLADSPVSLIERLVRWPIAWIVVDGLANVELSAEVQDLVAGLIGGNLAEESMPQELRRLRWLFLGRVPAFIEETQVTREKLDPMEVGTPDAMRCLTDYLSSIQRQVHDPQLIESLIDIWTTDVPVFADAATRLPAFQKNFQRFDSNFMKRNSTRQ